MKSLRSARSCTRLIALTALCCVLTACTKLADVLTPGERGSSSLQASISLNATIAGAQLSPSDAVNLSVVVSYIRRDASRVRITSLSRTLGSSSLQAVPIGVDVATCLVDPERDGAEGSCLVVLQLALSVNGTVVDEQEVGPMRLTPGQPANVPGGPVTLFDIASMGVQDASGQAIPPDAPLALTIGESRTIRALVRDTRGEVIAERVPTWSSDAPAVAAITERGDITAISAGTTRFVATLGQRSVVVSANVRRPTVAFEITGAAGSGRGVVRSTPAGIDCRVEGGLVSGQCSFAFDANTTVTLRSTPDSDNLFGAWSGGCAASADNSTCVVTLDQARQASAQFTALRRLTISSAAAGSARGRITSSAGLDCVIGDSPSSGVCSVQVAQGSTVTLTAIVEPSAGQSTAPRFGGWSDACAASDQTTCVVSLAAEDRVLNARFVAQRRLTVDLSGSGNGAVRSSPEGIECRVAGGIVSGTCSVVFDADVDVTLQSTADENNLFGAWSGECASSGSSRACVLTSGSPKQASARFTALRRVTITSGTSAGGLGRVTGSGGLDCVINGSVTSGTCAVQVPEGTTVSLNAVPEAASSGTTEFTGWGSGCSVTTATTCVFTVSGADRVVSAGFIGQRRLVVNVAGSGDGTVSSGQGIACARTASGATSGTCQSTFINGTQVSLRAQAAEGSDFVGFSGDCSTTSDATCTVSMTGSRTITATFTRRRVRLTLIVDGGRQSAGVVTLNNGEACAIAFGNAAQTCVRGYDAGTELVRLSAQPGDLSVFAGFTGDCSGTGSCNVTMSADRTVRVSFSAIPRAVNLVRSASASGAGRVQSADANQRIDCAYASGQPAPTGCSTTVPPATPVRLVATPSPASALLSWGEACAGTMTLTCVLSPMAASTDVSARFVTAIDVQMLVSGGAGSVAFEIPNVPSQGACASTATASNSCRFSLPVGTTGVFRAIPAAGEKFSGFRGPCLEGTGLVPTCTYRGFGFVREINAFFGDVP